MLDIEKLKLTDEELEQSYYPEFIEAKNAFRCATDRQLARALWGLIEQLEELGYMYAEDQCLHCVIGTELAEAGIAHPEWPNDT